MPRPGRVEADQPHGGGVEGDRVPAGEDHVQAARLAVGGTPAFHGDDPVHDAERRPEDAVERRQQGIEVAVIEDPVVLGQASPLVLDRAREARERVGLEHRERDEHVRVQEHGGQLDRPRRLAPDRAPRALGEVHQLHAQPLGDRT